MRADGGTIPDVYSPFTARVQPQTGSGTPTGTVVFQDGNRLLGTATLNGGTATYSTSGLGLGAHSITAYYSGDSTYLGSGSAPLRQVISGSTSIFTTQTPASTVHGAYELGVEFQSTSAGHITGLRFYKAVGETGTHTGHLWSASGTLQGSVTFSNETASGWQTASFATPIAVSANTTYVASFNTHLLLDYTGNALKTSVANGPLATLADGKNGVYSTTPGHFPNTGSSGNNYFADVVFSVP